MLLAAALTVVLPDMPIDYVLQGNGYLPTYRGSLVLVGASRLARIHIAVVLLCGLAPCIHVRYEVKHACWSTAKSRKLGGWVSATEHGSLPLTSACRFWP
jgi:hypothetical protein